MNLDELAVLVLGPVKPGLEPPLLGSGCINDWSETPSDFSQLLKFIVFLHHRLETETQRDV